MTLYRGVSASLVRMIQTNGERRSKSSSKTNTEKSKMFLWNTRTQAWSMMLVTCLWKALVAGWKGLITLRNTRNWHTPHFQEEKTTLRRSKKTIYVEAWWNLVNFIRVSSHKPETILGKGQWRRRNWNECHFAGRERNWTMRRDTRHEEIIRGERSPIHEIHRSQKKRCVSRERCKLLINLVRISTSDINIHQGV